MSALVAIGFLLIFVVYGENTFTGATIQIGPGQTVTLDGSVRDHAPSDVRKRSALHGRNPARARLVLELPRARRHDAVTAVAASRRRENHLVSGADVGASATESGVDWAARSRGW